jgi:hypothetical protein
MVYLKKKLYGFFLEISTHSAIFLELSQGIEDYLEIFDTFFTKFCPTVLENKSAKKFSLIVKTTIGQTYEFLAKIFFFKN